MRAVLGDLLIPDLWHLPSDLGAVAQLGERLLCKQEVTGSIPVGSTRADQTSARKAAPPEPTRLLPGRRLHQSRSSRHQGLGIGSFRGMKIEIGRDWVGVF
jgi:hypothetical protein